MPIIAALLALLPPTAGAWLKSQLVPLALGAVAIVAVAATWTARDIRAEHKAAAERVAALACSEGILALENAALRAAAKAEAAISQHRGQTLETAAADLEKMKKELSDARATTRPNAVFLAADDSWLRAWQRNPTAAPVRAGGGRSSAHPMP